MGILLIGAAYAAYAAFWIRFIAHVLVWWRAARRFQEPAGSRLTVSACARTAVDVVLLFRVLNVNPALWIGEWTFHASFLFVLLRHLRFFLDPVPLWVWRFQTPGLIAGYVLPFALAYILAVRLFTRHEKYAASANLFLLTLVLLIGSLGVLMHAWFKPDLVNVKLFVFGILTFHPTATPESLLFIMHFVLVLVLLPFLPTHIITAPLVLLEARKREQDFRLVIHDQ